MTSKKDGLVFYRNGLVPITRHMSRLRVRKHVVAHARCQAPSNAASPKLQQPSPARIDKIGAVTKRGKLPTIYPKQACDHEVAAKINEWIAGIARVYACRALHVVEVDRYFSAKWVRFSGKSLGALAWWKKRTTIPPFIPSRVLTEQRFLLKGPWARYEDKPKGYRLHIWQESCQNLHRLAVRVAPDVALVWYGGGSAAEGQASFMAYIPVGDEEHWCWYVGLKRAEAWSVDRLHRINLTELAYIEAHGKPNVFGPVPKRTPRGWR